MQHPEHSANIPPTWSRKTTLSDLPAEQHVPVQEAIDKEREPVRESDPVPWPTVFLSSYSFKCLFAHSIFSFQINCMVRLPGATGALIFYLSWWYWINLGCDVDVENEYAVVIYLIVQGSLALQDVCHTEVWWEIRQRVLSLRRTRLVRRPDFILLFRYYWTEIIRQRYLDHLSWDQNIYSHLCSYSTHSVRCATLIYPTTSYRREKGHLCPSEGRGGKEDLDPRSLGRIHKEAHRALMSWFL